MSCCDSPQPPRVLASGSSVRWDRFPPEAVRASPSAELIGCGKVPNDITQNHPTARSEQTRSAGLVTKSALFPEDLSLHVLFLCPDTQTLVM